ncbi:hypothetical protein LCGC14_2887010 [marine sediment metagenome]|uniref:Uncharacterized protein n=1 Tax=marine sediment metagenome TaxID=412755 RepID=A0A0F9APH2_9ZZZZ
MTMKQKEIDIQKALGTLPLWKRIELGEVKLEVVREVTDKDTTLTSTLFKCGDLYLWMDGAADNLMNPVAIDWVIKEFLRKAKESITEKELMYYKNKEKE